MQMLVDTVLRLYLILKYLYKHMHAKEEIVNKSGPEY